MQYRPMRVNLFQSHAKMYTFFFVWEICIKAMQKSKCSFVFGNRNARFIRNAGKIKQEEGNKELQITCTQEPSAFPRARFFSAAVFVHISSGFCRAIASTAPHNSTTTPHLCAPSEGTECQRGHRARWGTPRNSPRWLYHADR